MPHADLHVHTDRSDGTLSLEAVPEAARRNGVAVVGVTDHDRLQPALDGPVVVRDGVTIVHGIELKVQTDDQRLDLLGYGVEPTPSLDAEIDRLQADRRERGAAIVERVEDRLDIELDLEIHAGLGRPHIARAIEAHPEASYSYREAFDDLIGDGRPCFVERSVTPYERGRELLSEAAALVGLAHPLRYDDPGAAIDHAAELDAIERWYPYERAVDPATVERAIQAHGLLPTGGSDAHDDQLGRAGVSAADYGAIAARLPSPTESS
ncbi:MAG: PHP domain-containing protein [Halobacteriales archaeon]